MAIWAVWGVVLPNIRYTNLRYSYWGAFLELQKGGQSDYKREVMKVGPAVLFSELGTETIMLPRETII